MSGNRDHLLEVSQYTVDDGQVIGRDPRKVSREEWRQAGIERLTGMQAIRAMCLSCCHTSAEVRRCTVKSCPLWPYRFGSTPPGLRVPGTRGATKEASSSPKQGENE